MSGLRHSIDRLYAHLVNDKRSSPPFSWRWLNRLVERLFWENPGASIRPQYAWGIVLAAAQARALEHREVSVIEFGVAGGRGLLAMQEIAEEVSRISGVHIALHGFDTGEGLPAVTDPRDLPQLYRSGYFRMDHDALRRRMRPETALTIGDIRTTIDQFLAGTFRLWDSSALIWTFTRQRATH